MGKNLFGDLTTDVSDKYKNKNDATVIAEITERLDAVVRNLSRETRGHLWAEVVIETYENEYAENKEYADIIPSFKALYQLKLEAEKFLKNEVEMIENAKIYQAKAIDDKIKQLITSAKGKFWCDELDGLIKEINSLKDDIRSRCKKLGELDELKQVKERVIRALKVDDNILKLERTKAKTKNWCNSVISFNDVLDTSLSAYLTKKIILDELVKNAKELLIQIEAEEIELKKQQEIQKQEEAKKEIERKARLYEQELAKKNEEQRRNIQVQNEEIIRRGKEKLQNVISNCKEPSFEFDVEGEQVCLTRCTNSNLKNVIIPEGVEVINDAVFSDFDKLVKVTLPNSLNIIKSNAFSNCIKLKDINLNGYIKEIHEYAFDNCISLKKVHIGPSLKKISGTAFYDCTKLKEIDVSSGNSTFSSERGNLYSRDKKVLYRFCPANKTKNVLIYISVDYVNAYAFQGCRNIKTIKTNTVNVIGSYAFSDCVKLSKITIGSYVKALEYGCFKNCKKLKVIKASNGVYSKGGVEDHFEGCDKLAKKYKKWLMSTGSLKRNFVDGLINKYDKYK